MKSVSCMFVLVGLAVAMVNLATANTYTWTGGGGDTSWDTMDNWDPDLDAAGIRSGRYMYYPNDTFIFASGGAAAVIPNPGGWPYDEVDVGNVVFDSTSDFTISGGAYWRGLRVLGGIQVAASSGRKYTVVHLTEETGNTNAWNIGAGSVFQFNNLYRDAWQLGIVKTGAGEVNANGSGTELRHLRLLDGTWTENYSGVLYREIQVAAGVTWRKNPAIGNPTWRFGVFSGDYRPATYQPFNDDCAILGTVDGVNLTKYGKGTLRLTGNGVLTNVAVLTMYDGTLEVDNSTVNLPVRIPPGMKISYSGAQRLLFRGNADADSSQTVGLLDFYANNCVIEMTHGAGRSNTLNVTTYWGGNNQSVVYIKADDLGADGPGANRIYGVLPWAGNGYVLHPKIQVPGEFVVGDNRWLTGILPMSASGRQPSLDAAGTADNVLAASAQSALSGNRNPFSLKINGAYPINLNGYTCTIGCGGLIQTGGDGAISNGTLTSGISSLYVQTISNLTISASLNNGSDGLIKTGPGGLTVSGSMSTPTVWWYDGSFTYAGDQAPLIYGFRRFNAGTLTMSGTNMMTVTSDPWGESYYCSAPAGTTFDVQKGIMKMGSVANLDLGGAINVAGDAKLWWSWYPGGRDNMYLYGVDFSGSGTVMFNTAVDGSGTRKKVNSSGGRWKPGASAGVLTLDGNLAWLRNGGTNCTLEIDITGAGTTVGTDYDKLAVSGTVSGLNATTNSATVDLVVTVKPQVSGLSGNTYTILTSSSDFSGLKFREVRWGTPGTSGTVNYNNGSITLTGVVTPGPAGTILMLK